MNEEEKKNDGRENKNEEDKIEYECYNKYEIPSDLYDALKKAKEHRISMLPGTPTEGTPSKDRCGCCGRITYKKGINPYQSCKYEFPQDFGSKSPAVSSLFFITKKAIYLFSILAFISLIFVSVNYGASSKPSTGYSFHFIGKSSVGFFPEAIPVEAVFTTIMLLIFYYGWSMVKKETEREIDEREQSKLGFSDYSVIIKNLPIVKTKDPRKIKEFKELLEQHFRYLYGNDCGAEDVLLTRDIYEVTKKMNDLKDLSKKALICKRKCDNYKKQYELKHDKEISEEELSKYRNKVLTPKWYKRLFSCGKKSRCLFCCCKKKKYYKELQEKLENLRNDKAIKGLKKQKCEKSVIEEESKEEIKEEKKKREIVGNPERMKYFFFDEESKKEEEEKSEDSVLVRDRKEDLDVKIIGSRFSKRVEEEEQYEVNKVAIMTFVNPKIAERVKQDHSLSCCQKLCSHKPHLEFKVNDKILQVQEAPRPSDINWENLSLSQTDNYYKQFYCYFLLIFIIALNCTICLGLSQLKGTTGTQIFFICLFSALVTTITNSGISEIIRKFAKFERHHTVTNQELSIARKEFGSRLFTTILVPLLIHPYSDKWFEDGDLLTEIFLYILVTSFIYPLMDYFDFNLIYIGWNKCWVRKTRKYQMVKTQSEINKIFEPPKFNIPLKYSKLATMILLPIFYLPIFPLGMLFSLVGLIFFYWTQKKLLLSRYQKPEYRSGYICRIFLKIILFGPIILYFSMGTFYYIIDNNAIGFWVIFAILPFIFAFQYYMKVKIELNPSHLEFTNYPKTKRLYNWEVKLYHFLEHKRQKFERDPNHWVRQFDHQKFGFKKETYLQRYPLGQFRADLKIYENTTKELEKIPNMPPEKVRKINPKLQKDDKLNENREKIKKLLNISVDESINNYNFDETKHQNDPVLAPPLIGVPPIDTDSSRSIIPPPSPTPPPHFNKIRTKCDFCNKKIKNARNNQELVTKHENEECLLAIKCPGTRCKKLVRVTRLNYHIFRSKECRSEEEFAQCKNCKNVVIEKYLKQHLEECTKKIESKSFKCIFCKKTTIKGDLNTLENEYNKHLLKYCNRNTQRRSKQKPGTWYKPPPPLFQ